MKSQKVESSVFKTHIYLKSKYTASHDAGRYLWSQNTIHPIINCFRMDTQFYEEVWLPTCKFSNSCAVLLYYVCFHEHNCLLSVFIVQNQSVLYITMRASWKSICFFSTDKNLYRYIYIPIPEGWGGDKIPSLNFCREETLIGRYHRGSHRVLRK